MHIVLRLLGCTVLELHTTDTDEPTDYDDDPGSTTTYPIGFTAGYDLPDEAALPERWGDDQ